MIRTLNELDEIILDFLSNEKRINKNLESKNENRYYLHQNNSIKTNRNRNEIFENCIIQNRILDSGVLANIC